MKSSGGRRRVGVDPGRKVSDSYHTVLCPLLVTLCLTAAAAAAAAGVSAEHTNTETNGGRGRSHHDDEDPAFPPPAAQVASVSSAPGADLLLHPSYFTHLFSSSSSSSSSKTTELPSALRPTTNTQTTPYIPSGPPQTALNSSSSIALPFPPYGSSAAASSERSPAASAVIFHPSVPVIVTSANASLQLRGFHDVTRAGGSSEATTILRLRIRVGPEVNVRSPQFVAWMKAALERLYRAALAKRRQRSPWQATGQRQRRQVQTQPEVTAQVLGVGRGDAGVSDDVAVDFTLAQDGRHVTPDVAMASLANLTNSQMQGIITFPMQGLTKEKVSVNGTLTVGDPTAADLTIITTGIFVVATRYSSTTSSSISTSSSSSTSSELESSLTTTTTTAAMTATPPFSSAGPATATTWPLPTVPPSVVSSSVSASSSTVAMLTSSVSPVSPPVSSTTPSSSATKPTDELRESLMSVDLDMTHMAAEAEDEFRRNFERGIVRAYLQALQARRKRHVPVYDVIIHVQRHERYLRQAVPELDAQVTQVRKNSAEPKLTNVTFYMMEDGRPIPAPTATAIFNKLTATALSAILYYPVVSLVYPVDRPPLLTDPPDGDGDGDGWMFVAVIVLPSVLLLLLVLTLLAVLIHGCRLPLVSPAEAARPVVTKYQRGDSLSDFSQHMDMEGGEEPMALTHLRSSRSRPLPSSPVIFHDARDHPRPPFSHADSPQRRLQGIQWSKTDHHHQPPYRKHSVDCLARVHHEVRENDYVDTSFMGRGEPPKRRHSRERQSSGEEVLISAAGKSDGEEAAVRRAMAEPETATTTTTTTTKQLAASYVQNKPPQATPRGFKQKMHSLKRGGHHNKYSFDQHSPAHTTTTTAASRGSASVKAERRRSRDKGKRPREPKPRERVRRGAHAQHTDASDEFTIVASPVFLSAYSSRERLASSNSGLTDLSEMTEHREFPDASRQYTRRTEEKSWTASPVHSEANTAGYSSGKDDPDRSTEDPDISTEDPHTSASADRYNAEAVRRKRPSQSSQLSSPSHAQGHSHGDGQQRQRGYLAIPQGPHDPPHPSRVSTTQTQTSLSLRSDVSEGGGGRKGAGRKSVAVGPDSVSKRTQTPGPQDAKKQHVHRKPREPVRFSSRPSFGENGNSTVDAAQSLLRQQQQEVMAYVRRHLGLVESPPHLLPASGASATTSPPPPTSPHTTTTATAPTAESNRRILGRLLNEACVLAPQHPGPQGGYHQPQSPPHPSHDPPLPVTSRPVLMNGYDGAEEVPGVWSGGAGGKTKGGGGGPTPSPAHPPSAFPHGGDGFPAAVMSASSGGKVTGRLPAPPRSLSPPGAPGGV
ncbi:uncharacterized protein LOC143286900 [Babylonia areolata]|uniref:uncharacterized protein LOC143286900 n=1 Tax=Babylonia areolata TaxID=304850 RepID=UPI003FD6814E